MFFQSASTPVHGARSDDQWNGCVASIVAVDAVDNPQPAQSSYGRRHDEC